MLAIRHTLIQSDPIDWITELYFKADMLALLLFLVIKPAGSKVDTTGLEMTNVFSVTWGQVEAPVVDLQASWGFGPLCSKHQLPGLFSLLIIFMIKHMQKFIL